MPNSYTQVEAVGDFDGAENRWSCNDCGAHGTVKEQIVHHKTCEPGESKRWEKFYTEANEEEKMHNTMVAYEAQQEEEDYE